MNSKTARLVLPTTLLVTTIATGSCTADDSGDGGTMTVADTDMSASASATTTTTTGDDEVVYCSSLDTIGACDMFEYCRWIEVAQYCENGCYRYEDEASCVAVDQCLWDPSGDGTCFWPDPAT